IKAIVYYNIYNHTQQEKALKFIKKPYSTKGLSKVWTKTSDKVGRIRKGPYLYPSIKALIQKILHFILLQCYNVG
ncbi:hypothetical protein, partial [Streptococcus equi]